MLLFSKILVPKGYLATTIYPFILLSPKYKHMPKQKQEVVINHEKIHLTQQLEMLIIPFYIVYFISYLFNIIRYKNHNKAYRNIIFEKEAYAYEQDLKYLSKRKKYNFLRLKK